MEGSSPDVLRAGVLDGARVVVAGVGDLGEAVGARAAGLGAEVERLPVDPWADEPQRPVASACSCGTAAALALRPGVDGVRAALDGAWLRSGPWRSRVDRGGLIVLLAPPPGDARAEAARAGLESLARTSSIEWARFCVRPVAVLPGAGTAAGEVAELTAYLASPAGAHYAGCAFTLGVAPG